MRIQGKGLAFPDGLFRGRLAKGIQVEGETLHGHKV